MGESLDVDINPRHPPSQVKPTQSEPSNFTTSLAPKKGPIWWSNAIFFIGMHVMAIVGAFYISPWAELDIRTSWMCFFSWQLATFGITVGYHRLWSHKAFTATFPLRVVLAGMGCLGFQGSIKWWVLRHRLHHRFTDSESDPYNANEGLYHSHMGWIFRKPDYPRMGLIDRKDLDLDPVVRFQHRYYLPLTLSLGILAPTLIGWTYGDAVGGYIWGGIVARIMIWHFTFFINSLAHYMGEQAYSEDVTARGNFFLALFTGGEANHNYHHAFPKDYRNGPRLSDWDPTKWIIYVLHHYTPFVPKIYSTPESDILKARAHVLSQRSELLENANGEEEDQSKSSFARWSTYAEARSELSSGSAGSASSSNVTSSAETSGVSSSEDDHDTAWEDNADDLLEGAPPRSKTSSSKRSQLTTSRGGSSRKKLPTWTQAELVRNVEEMKERVNRAGEGKTPVVLFLEGFAVDATSYANDHPGGVALLRQYSVGSTPSSASSGWASSTSSGIVALLPDATSAFNGGLNMHGWPAREKVRGMRVAKIIDG